MHRCTVAAAPGQGPAQHDRPSVTAAHSPQGRTRDGTARGARGRKGLAFQARPILMNVATVVNRGTLLVGGAKSSHRKEWHVGPQARRGWNYAGTARPFGLMLLIFPNGRG